MKKRLTTILCLALTLALLLPALALGEEAADTRPRTIVTTDVEVDDMDSLLHLLLYANDIDIAGIIITSSTHHWTGDGEHSLAEVITDYKNNGDRTPDFTEWRPMELDWIYDMLRNEYTSVYSNLIKHDPRYPAPGELIERTKLGNYKFEGDMREATEGSEYVKTILLDDDMRELYVQAWGGCNTIARALLSIEEEYKNSAEWEAVYKKVSEKVTLISFGDQDNTYPNYIAVNWPDINRLYCVTGGIGYRTSLRATIPYREYFKPEWLTENIKFNHGPLMSKYVLFGDGTYLDGELPHNQFGNMNAMNMEASWLKNDWERYEFISEGDSPCWMYLIPVGLRGLENTSYGSWGGRMGLGVDRSGKEVIMAIGEFDPTLGKIGNGYSVHRWFPAFMNDWAARADWCVTDYENANHQPVVTAEALNFEAYPGASVELKGSATDPDGDALACNWWVYTDASLYRGAYASALDVWGHDVSETAFTVPADAQEGDYFNLVFEVTDSGSPALTRYAQAIVTVLAPPAEEAPAK